MSPERDAQIAEFLSGAGARGAVRAPLAGDASLRRYERLTLPGGGTAVLMDAPPRSGEDIRPFVKIAQWLADAGYSAPRILAQNADQGLLLLEDLGDALYSTEVARDPRREGPLYAAATDLLADLQEVAPPPDLPVYDTDAMTDRAALAWRWYRPGGQGADDGGFRQAMAETLDAHAGGPAGVALRDFHAQNLIWLPHRGAAARVGLLDFQDAMRAPDVYDLVSLLTDARRDVPPSLAAEMTDRFIARRGAAPIATRAACAVVGLQRNLRILGVFARLSLHFGKPSYIDLIPRVWAHIDRDLAHPAAAALRPIIARDLPPPHPDHLHMLKDRCGTVPTL